MGKLIFFRLNPKEQHLFIYGKEDENNAEKAALECKEFKFDVEEEWVSDRHQTCYNCRYRRWTATSFVCLKKEA